ncbi:binding protein 2 like protein, partial [Syncephalis pseudoplumigaleata]
MQLTRLVTLVAVVGAMLPAVAVAEKKTPPAELRIGIKKRIPEEECPRKAQKGDTLKMHYTGRLFEDGTEFDSSVGRGVPFEFTLGSEADAGAWFASMCIGEKRKLSFPAEYGYGQHGSPPTIPPNAALVFDVELLGIN